MKYKQKIKFMALASCLLLSSNALADVYDDYATTNRQNFTFTICEVSAAHYKSHSVWVSDVLSSVYQNSKPNSSDRKKLLAQFDSMVEKSDDDDYNKRKEFARKVAEGNSSRTELTYQVSTYARQIAYQTAVTQPGKSATFYQRTIEQECKSKVN